MKGKLRLKNVLKICDSTLEAPFLHLIYVDDSGYYFDNGSNNYDLLLLLICPVHKGGLRSIPKNFRPVELASHIIKVFERVVRKALKKHLETNNQNWDYCCNAKTWHNLIFD